MTSYTLVVQNAAHERQLRRLGTSLCLLWEQIPQAIKDKVIRQASMIHISGEVKSSEEIEGQLSTFLETRTISVLADKS